MLLGVARADDDDVVLHKGSNAASLRILQNPLRLSRVQEPGSDSPKASFERAMTFLRAGDAALAEKICRQALDAFPRDANLLCVLGASMLKQDRAAEAEHTLSRAVRMYPAFARAHETLADALIMQGRLPEALASLDRAAELEPGSASVRFKKGKVLDGLGRDDEASSQFEESFKLTPFREELVRGLRLQRMGNGREAERIYRDVLLRDPDNVDALRLLASVAMRAKQWGDAEVLLEKALEKAPDFFQGWMDLGLARQEQDRTDDALDAYAHAMRLEPDRPSPYGASATTNAMAGRHDEALRLYEEALVINTVRLSGVSLDGVLCSDFHLHRGPYCRGHALYCPK